MWSEYFEIRVEPNLDKNTACSDMATFLPDLEPKITGSQIWVGLGSNLGDPNIVGSLLCLIFGQCRQQVIESSCNFLILCFMI